MNNHYAKLILEKRLQDGLSQKALVSDATLFQSVIFRLFNLKITDFFYL